MKDLILDEYANHSWADDKDYAALINKVSNRKFQPSKELNIEIGATDLDILCLSRFETNKNAFLRNRKSRTYSQRVYAYDSVNELERLGFGRYKRNYQIIISFEDSLDFILSCLLKCKQGIIKEFCDSKNIDYKLYSRQMLGGGKVKDIYFNDLYGCCEQFDILVKAMGYNDSVEKGMFYDILYKFCEMFRNAMLVHVGSDITGDTGSILASVGVSSLLYYSNSAIEDTLTVRYHAAETKLKLMNCYMYEYTKIYNDSYSF